MPIELTEDESSMLAATDRFIEREMKPVIGNYVREHQFPTPVVEAFAKAGFMGVAYDPAFDGGGLGARGAALLAARLAETEPGFAAIFLCNSAPMTVLARFGSDRIKQEWLAPLCRGETLASFGVTEPHGGSDVAQIKTRAREDGNDFVLDGSKVFSTNAGTPPHGVTTVVAVTDPDKGPKGLSTFAVPVGTPGFSIGKPGRKIGWRIAPSCELFFDGCRIPKTAMIGNRGDGLKQILTTLAIGRVLVAATALGLTRKATRLAVGYGSGRKLFGHNILQNQGLSFPLADILTKCYAAELMIQDAAQLVDQERPFKSQTSMVKLFATEMAVEAATLAIQVHGGYGVFEEYDVSGLLGEAKVLTLVEGTSEIQRLVIARDLVEF
ncbi:acyl-CoA dehydrogenase family protein [Bradyrhizobium lablabi]|uniref:acyl-CoA dehydrogenase family protein n=1 Tax=Bradyrhizobium lablabi TaxID=722472 RepID=UPI001BAD5C72|nr:acyl-CoA dehydrogenase family protein [Bradyrhizobium lablabi]MBR1125145.1 acyl-CoA dehydrogenase family protein [Bradyrhizobium lablabi]